MGVPSDNEIRNTTTETPHFEGPKMGPKWAILEVPSHLRRAIWHYVISQRYPQGLGGRTGTNHTRAGRGIGVGEDLEPGPSIVPQIGPK